MTLSLCMIVKDEAHNLPRLFTSLGRHGGSIRGGIDEVCIIDTGSTDGTTTIARGYADKYAEREWVDFSDARNASLDLATGDYILILDADEYIEQFDFFSVLREAMDAGVLSADLIVTSFVGQGSTDTVFQTRLFKRGSARYEGGVHNQLKVDRTQPGQQVRLPCTIYHTGYDLTPDERTKKYAPRLSLYERILQETTGQEHHYYRYQFGACLFMLQRFAEAIGVFEAIDTDVLQEAFLPHLLSMQGKAYLQMKDHQSALRIAHAFNDRYESGISLNLLGVAQIATGTLMEGLHNMCKAYLAPRTGRFQLSEEAFRASFATLLKLGGDHRAQAIFREGTNEEVMSEVLKMHKATQPSPQAA